MRAAWEALHQSLTRSVISLRAQCQLRAVQPRYPALQGYRDPAALEDFLTSQAGSLDEKDAIYAALVSLVQQGEAAEFATTMLWAGLWPGLDAIFWRQLRLVRGRSDELVSELGDCFMRVVHRAELARIRRVAATLVRNTERDISAARQREWRTARLEVELPEDEQLEQHAGRPGALERPSLGLPPGLSPDAQVVSLRELIAVAVGVDAELIVGVVLRGASQREMAEQLGLSHEATRKRYQRAMQRLRTHLQEF